MSQWWLPNCFGQWLPQILLCLVMYSSVHILGSSGKTYTVDQRNLGERLGKTEEEEAGRCRRALGCELVYGTMKSCSEAAK